jgi:hypothetical protein
VPASEMHESSGLIQQPSKLFVLQAVRLTERSGQRLT